MISEAVGEYADRARPSSLSLIRLSSQPLKVQKQNHIEFRRRTRAMERRKEGQAELIESCVRRNVLMDSPEDWILFLRSFFFNILFTFFFLSRAGRKE